MCALLFYVNNFFKWDYPIIEVFERISGTSLEFSSWITALKRYKNSMNTQDIQLHMRFCYMRKNAFNKRYIATGAWVITEQTTNKETKRRPSIQQEDRKNTSFGVNFLENYCETTKCRFGWYFYKVRLQKYWEKNGNFFEKVKQPKKTFFAYFY